MKSRLIVTALVVSMGAVVALASGSLAQVTKGKSRPLTTKQLMGGHVAANCGPLGQALQGNGPADDAGWTAAATKAALLNEASYTLMDDGRCPDATWADACMTLRKCSSVVLDKIAAKDASGAREAFTAMTGSCKSCHTAHKK